MRYRSVCFSAIAVALLLSFTVRAGDDDGKKGKHKGAGFVALVLSHAADLNLTDDQKTKLTALEDSEKPPEGGDKDKMKEYNKEVHGKVAEILNKDQKEKLKELTHSGKKAGGDKAAAAPAKEEKKDDAKDEKKEAPAAAEEKKDEGNNMGN